MPKLNENIITDPPGKRNRIILKKSVSFWGWTVEGKSGTKVPRFEGLEREKKLRAFGGETVERGGMVAGVSLDGYKIQAEAVAGDSR